MCCARLDFRRSQGLEIKPSVVRDLMGTGSTVLPLDNINLLLY